jgi:hypothetical protein
MAARESIHPGTGDPRAECRRKPAGSRQGTPRQDQEAGFKPAGGASRTHAGAGERADQEGRKPGEDREPGGPQALRELAAARGEGRKAGAKQRGHKPQADSRRAGERDASPGNRNRGPDGAADASQLRPRVKGMPEGRFTTKAQRREPNAGERQARRLAGRKGRRRRARALGRAPEPEGGRRVERKRGAQALSESQPESEARGSGRESELRATPKGQGKGACRKASSEGRKPEPRRDGGRRIDRRREVAGLGLMSWRRRELETRSRQGRRQGASQAGGSAGGQEQAARDGCRSQGSAARLI